ncbi:hypothetical protein R70723_12250 [Paenibacillus sp. FSL R7-0273]|uniref:hypothetical protein n=1 Tax=Paenibacillus sp. FSL R7-0273 TaxID=1536772 RepID=UPI0004F8661C|nr:hypothetical protein [Paenibacillus sp. FSL R7-0273]AIQ46555.1 hypothetical protein R70723_12250 [Paenibacillus sp. FSL R7-0273]OMF97676.1 hypothetical protein BK144_03320 [Paenibacillus sp. FSL R7-0273]
MSKKKSYYAFEDPRGTTIEFQATSLQQAMVIKKKRAQEMGIPKEAFELTSIRKKPVQSA